MNSSYTTLGEGRNTALLAFDGRDAHRKVSTLDHEAAAGAARWLSHLDTTIANALYDVAIAHPGEHIEVRRRLLAEFDDTVTATQEGTERPLDSDCWQLAATPVRSLAAAVAHQAGPVIAAVRRELADTILVDLDGPLVAGALVAECYRPAHLRLVLNQWLGTWTSGDRTYLPWLDGLDVEAANTVESIADVTGVGVFIGDDTWMIVDGLRSERSAHVDIYAEANAHSIFADSGEEYPCLMVNPTHLRAWAAARHPEVLDQYPTLGVLTD